ncbi:GNAT family N-acetyltransferase [Cytobacillus sp. FJAT-54145]|uniref:GNAT family N-acetyltransferase n=1 Tax=Cytobacillus spartinae TaxID=3299023 RepID=A0ABW6K721_9BACI
MSSHFTFVKGYQDDKVLSESFIQLAKDTFAIDFTRWLEKGYWTSKYIPYSFVDGDKVIANVSVNLIGLMVDGKKKRGIQIGTVMTHKDYRNNGLSRKLMDHILDEYEGLYDVMYLFANQSVLEFYPKFGFHTVEETIFYVDEEIPKTGDGHGIRKLNGENDLDLQFIYEFAKGRKSTSNIFGTTDTEELLLFYCLNVFSNEIYYLEKEEIIAIYQVTDSKELHIYDIIAKEDVSIRRVLEKIGTHEVQKVIFHFTVVEDDLPIEKEVYKGNNEVLFVKLGDHTELPRYFKHPLTSQA